MSLTTPETTMNTLADALEDLYTQQTEMLSTLTKLDSKISQVLNQLGNIRDLCSVSSMARPIEGRKDSMESAPDGDLYSIEITSRPFKKSGDGFAPNTTAVFEAFVNIASVEPVTPGVTAALASVFLDNFKGWKDGVGRPSWGVDGDPEKLTPEEVYAKRSAERLISHLRAFGVHTKTPEIRKTLITKRRNGFFRSITNISRRPGSREYIITLLSLFQDPSEEQLILGDNNNPRSSTKQFLTTTYLGAAIIARLEKRPDGSGQVTSDVTIPDGPIPLIKYNVPTKTNSKRAPGRKAPSLE